MSTSTLTLDLTDPQLAGKESISLSVSIYDDEISGLHTVEQLKLSNGSFVSSFIVSGVFVSGKLFELANKLKEFEEQHFKKQGKYEQLELPI